MNVRLARGVVTGLVSVQFSSAVPTKLGSQEPMQAHGTGQAMSAVTCVRGDAATG